MAKKLHLLRREMNNFQMEKLEKRFSKKPDLRRPKNVMPYNPAYLPGIFLPSPKKGYPYSREQIDMFMKAAREAFPEWREAVTAAFVALKELSERKHDPKCVSV